MAIERIPLSSVKPSPMNPRKTFDEEALSELSESIEKQGLLQPVLVRPTAEADKYEVVCGERRYRAVKLLEAKDPVKFGFIECNVREMNDDDAFDAMITENLQRKDVDPIEEAFAFNQLVRKGKKVEDIALRFGKSVRFVTDRIKLNSLIPELLLEVKEDRMPITSAMLLCKIDEDKQRHFFNTHSQSYSGFSRSSVETYLQNIFLQLDNAPWVKSKTDAVPDYSGGCGVKCSECIHNTDNHGCLFWEMKKTSSAKCTNREKYREKVFQYIKDMLKKHDAAIVRKGEPYAKGKCVICINRYQERDPDAKKMIENLEAICDARGYEHISDVGIFNGVSYYGIDDERLQAKIKSGEVYPVITLFDFSYPRFDVTYYNVRKGSNSINCNEDGVPIEVTRLVEELETVKRNCDSAVRVAAFDAIAEKSVFDNSPIDEMEMEVVLLLMLSHSYDLQRQANVRQYVNDRKLGQYLVDHPEEKPRIVREWVRSQIKSGGVEAKWQLRDYMEKLGKKWCPTEYAASIDKAEQKNTKNAARIVAKLEAKGFNADGTKKPTERKIEGNSGDLKVLNASKLEKYDEMKKKMPDTIPLVRVGDAYKTFRQDAATLGIVLGMTVGTVKERGNDVDAFAFSSSELDHILPKIVAAGYRVVLNE
jgi:ParB/RepB/Spo0J family partition protein